MSDLKQRFDEAVDYVQNAEGGFEPSNDTKLQFYALYKQATEGDVKGKKPGMLDVVGRAKYNAWEKLKGKSSAQAMQEYVDLLAEMKRKHG
jgi:diazepam-binding inhibitor (GABA receptor modulating acyl-CoA-binding protein)